MHTDATTLENLKNIVNPLADPIDIINIIPKTLIPKIEGKIGDERLRREGSGTTGLDRGNLMLAGIDDIIACLNKLDFSKSHDFYYDCEDRAFWGMAHVLSMYPGVAIGVASGKVSAGKNAGKDHALIVIWYKYGNDLKPVYFSPSPVGPHGELEGVIKEEQFSPSPYPFSILNSIVSFPIGPNTTSPVDLLTPLDNKILIYDEKRIIYKKSDIFGYFRGRLSDQCKEDHSSTRKGAFQQYWRHENTALWEFVHVRRAYPGCPVGVAIGTPKDGKSNSVIILWHKKNDDPEEELTFSYWDPHLDLKDDERVVDFNPKTIFV